MAAPGYPSPNTQGFASYCTGHRVFPPDLLAPLYLAVRDRRILSFFLDECGVAFYELPECGEDADLPLMRQIVSAQKESVHVLEAVIESLEDDRITRKELVQIETLHYTSQSAWARLLACVRAKANRRPAAGPNGSKEGARG